MIYLKSKLHFLKTVFVMQKGIIVDQCIEDYGSGLNYNRKKVEQIIR